MSTRIPLVWGDGLRGYWDHGLVMLHAADDLFRTACRYEIDHVENRERAWAWNEGALYVIPGTLNERYAQIRDVIARMPWSVTFCLSDEEARFPVGEMPGIVWHQHAWPGRPSPVPIDHRMPNGIHHDTREWLRQIRNGGERDYVWAFLGQSGHPHRQRLFAELRVLEAVHGKTFLGETPGFSQGSPKADYYRMLLRTKIAPCPSGPMLADSFRVYESLECGALPVVNRDSPHPVNAGHDLWPTYFAEVPPFPRVWGWDEFAGIVSRLVADPVELQRQTNAATAWWIRQKRRIANQINDDIQRASGIAPTPRSALAGRVTVLMPSSPIPSHPSLDIIADAVKRIRDVPELAGCEILILLDGVRVEQSDRAASYEEYKRRLIDACNWSDDFAGCMPVVFDKHTHQVAMTRAALSMVRTPLVYFVEHDTYAFGDIPWQQIADAMSDAVPVVRFHIFHTVLPEHQHLYHEREEIGGVPLVRTTQWSQRPHLALTSYYRWLLDTYTREDDISMIEDRVHGPVENEPWERFRVRVYAPEGDMTRSQTSNGRQGDPKMAMWFDGQWRNP